MFLLKLGLLFSGFLEAKDEYIENSSAASPLYLKHTMVVGYCLISHRVVNEDFNTKREIDTQVHTVTGHAMDKWPCYLNMWIAQDNFLFLRCLAIFFSISEICKYEIVYLVWGVSNVTPSLPW